MSVRTSPSTSTATSAGPGTAGPGPTGPGAAGATGRPRDPRIDDAVLLATRELLVEVGYLSLSMAAIAEWAGTNKPAIYRRWPTKAHLVHEAVFPPQPPGGTLGGDRTTPDLRADIHALVTVGVELLGSPAARAALPGLLAEASGSSSLRADVLGRFADGAWGWLHQRLEAGIEAGEVRADVEPSTVLEVIAGSALLATVLRPLDDIGPDWVDHVVELVMQGIAP